MESDIEKQRDKLLKQFRTQLLRAAPKNEDIDSSWLGVDVTGEEPIPFLPEDATAEGPEGVSLSDISTPEEKVEAPSKSGLDLMAALLSKKEASSTPETESKEETAPEEEEFSKSARPLGLPSELVHDVVPCKTCA